MRRSLWLYLFPILNYKVYCMINLSKHFEENDFFYHIVCPFHVTINTYFILIFIIIIFSCALLFYSHVFEDPTFYVHFLMETSIIGLYVHNIHL